MSHPAPDRFDPVTVFAALGDPTRLGLVSRLANGEPLSITRLTEGTMVTRQAVTRHLEVLADAGLVHAAWRGRERLWELESARLELARRSLERIADWWDDQLSELKTSLEKA